MLTTIQYVKAVVKRVTYIDEVQTISTLASLIRVLRVNYVNRQEELSASSQNHLSHHIISRHLSLHT